MNALMMGEEAWDSRIELMRTSDLDLCESSLALHLASVDFLAAACIGKKLSTASAVSLGNSTFFGVFFFCFCMCQSKDKK